MVQTQLADVSAVRSLRGGEPPAAERRERGEQGAAIVLVRLAANMAERLEFVDDASEPAAAGEGNRASSSRVTRE